MKTIKAPYILILLVFCTSFCMVNGQPFGNYYYYKNKKIELPLNKERILLYYQNNQDTEKHLETEYGMTKVQDRCVSSEQKDVLCGEFQLKNAQDYFTILERLHSDQNIIDIERVFGSENPVSISNRFYVNLHNPEDFEHLKQMADANNVRIIERFGLDNWYVLETTVASSSDALDCCNLFYESGLFKGVDPGFIVKIVHNASVTDSSFDQQWAIDGLGVDIHAKDAWDLTKGKPGIKVAVVEGRIDETHNEFIGTNFVNPYVASPGFDYFDKHGTAVASIMAANHNSYEIAGVAPELTYLNTIVQDINSTNAAESYAKAISYAFHNGADVINCSWSFHYDNFPVNSWTVEDVIDSALYMGRNGKGCIVVFSSGNENRDSLPYPARYNPDLLVVGAVDINGNRVYIANNNGSNYGPGLDVMAPGHDIYMASASNYNYPSSVIGSHYYTGWGTSFAAPHVSAIAGLILSVAPNLTRKKVVDYIEQSCDKNHVINPYYTINKPNGPWIADYGYGLVDAYKSLVKEVNDSILDANFNSLYVTNGCIVRMSDYKDLNHPSHSLEVNSDFATEITCLFSVSDSYMYINAMPTP